MKLTKIQITTLVALAAFLVWEFFVKRWEAGLPPSDPVIRADLLFWIPVLAILVLISVYQFVRKKT